jgi:flagellar biosynthesis protein
MDADPNAPRTDPANPAKVDRAVALDYGSTGQVPTVVAVGQGAVARQILDIAFAHGVKVREDSDLVEILATLDLGDEIPAIAFAAVAEILSHVYRWELHQRQMDETP